MPCPCQLCTSLCIANHASLSLSVCLELSELRRGVQQMSCPLTPSFLPLHFHLEMAYKTSASGSVARTVENTTQPPHFIEAQQSHRGTKMEKASRPSLAPLFDQPRGSS